MAFKEIELNMGPQHPSTHGVLRLKLIVDNEVVLSIEPVIGYLHRGMEKLWESLTYPQIVPLTDRLDYLAAVSNNLAYVLAVEKLMGLEIPKRAQYIRVILAELQRLASHLAGVGFMANDVGAVSVLLYGFQSREGILDIFENYSGGRLTVHGIRIGGVPFDLDGKVAALIRKILAETPGKIRDIEGLLNENRIWKHRTKGIGTLSPEDAFAYGLTGPALRAIGFAWDIRKNIPYCSYEDFDFEVPVLSGGDVYDRYLVRMEEMRQSMRIIEQALDRLPAGDFQAKVPRSLKIPPGEVFHTIESPKGELGFYIKSNGTAKPERVKMKSPSFINLQSLELMCKGNLFSDIVGILGSLDIVLGEIDKMKAETLVFELLIPVAKIIAVILYPMIMVIVMIWLERRVVAWIQGRVGPNRVGFQGILQPIADALKLFFKEDIIQKEADVFLFNISPVLVMFSSLLAFCFVPLGESFQIGGYTLNLWVAASPVGLLLVLGLSAVGVFGIIFGGWASNSKYPLMGALRSVVQVLSYEIPIGLTVLTVVFFSRSIDLVEIVNHQQHGKVWFGFLLPVSFVVFWISGIAETNRAPFDLPEAESELVAGYHTEYSGMKFAYFYIAEYTHMVLVSSLVVILFFGGWLPPFPNVKFFSFLRVIPGFVWYLIKIMFFLYVYVWIRATLPRYRFDALIKLAWKWLVPLSLANFLVVVAVKYLL